MGLAGTVRWSGVRHRHPVSPHPVHHAPHAESNTERHAPDRRRAVEIRWDERRWCDLIVRTSVRDLDERRHVHMLHWKGSAQRHRANAPARDADDPEIGRIPRVAKRIEEPLLLGSRRVLEANAQRRRSHGRRTLGEKRREFVRHEIAEPVIRARPLDERAAQRAVLTFEARADTPFVLIEAVADRELWRRCGGEAPFELQGSDRRDGDSGRPRITEAARVGRGAWTDRFVAVEERPLERHRPARHRGDGHVPFEDLREVMIHWIGGERTHHGVIRAERHEPLASGE
jgi:hypothetical protein